MMRNIRLLLVLCCAGIKMANAQGAGYIITLNNDTLKGEVKTNFWVPLKFKPLNAANFKTVKLDTIREYQLTADSTIYVGKVIPLSGDNFISRPQFIRRLEHGRIDLFQQVTGSSVKTITWYISKNPDSLIALKTTDPFLTGSGSKKERRQIFINMVADDAYVMSVLNRLNTSQEFSFPMIRVSIRRYNRDAAQKSQGSMK